MSFFVEIEKPIPKLEKAIATNSSTLAWKIPWTEEPGRLQSMGSRRVGHDWATSLSLFTFLHWRRKWQPIPVFLPGESQGWRSLVGCYLWGCTESDTIEATFQQQQHETKGDLWFTTPAVVSVISFTSSSPNPNSHILTWQGPGDACGHSGSC